MSGLIYEASFENELFGDFANERILSLTMDGAAIAVHYFQISSDGSENDVLSIIIYLRTAVAPTAGAALTEVPRQRRNTVAATVEARINDLGGGLAGIFWTAWWHRIAGPLTYHPSPETRIILDSAQPGLVIVNNSNRNDAPCSGTIIWEEF